MIGKTLAVLAAGVSAVNAACAYPPPGGQLAGNSLTRPDLTHPATKGEEMEIVWDATGLSNSVTLILLRGPGENIKYLETIVSGTANTGSYKWTPRCDLETDTTHYGMMIVEDSTCKFQWSTQFGMNAGNCGSSSSSVAPSSSSAAPSSSGSVHPPSSMSTHTRPYMSESSADCDEPETAAPWAQPTGGWKNNGTWGPGATTSTYWLPSSTAAAIKPSVSNYKPAYSNDAGRFGMNIMGGAAALVAALMLL